MRAALLLASILLLAGCVAPGGAVEPASAPGDFPADWAERALPSGGGHDHRDRTAHEGLTTPNFLVVGQDPLVTQRYGRPAGAYHCADAGGDESRRIAVVQSLGGSDVVFVVADVTDPAAPAYLGELELRGTTARDVAVSADAKHVLVATELVNLENLLAPPEVAMSASFRDACGTIRALPLPAGVPAASGLLLVSLEDPTAPVVTDYFPLPLLGAHSVGVDRVDGVDIVNAAVTNGAQQASYFTFFTIEDGKLAFQSVYQHTPVAPNTPALNLHNDAWIRKHPVTNQTIAYLADWDAGLALLDLSDMKMPRALGRWSDYEAARGLDNSAAVHSALPLEATWNGKHYTFIGQEILARPRDTPTGVVSVLDTTDPTAPVRVGAWTLPVDVEWDAQLVFSTHYLTMVNETLFVTMYHGGVWALDVSEPTAPRSAGVFMPSEAPPEKPVVRGLDWSPTVLEAKALDTGDVAIWDGTSGLYIVRFDPLVAVPPVEEWAFAWTP